MTALETAKKLFLENNLDAAKTTLFIQPFTSTPYKNWSRDNYLAVARHWRSRGVQVIFGGSEKQLLLGYA